MKELAIILLNFNGTADTIECMKSLDASKTSFSYDVYILDNASKMEECNDLMEYVKMRDDFSVCDLNEFLQKDTYGTCLVMSKENLGFAGGNNRVIEKIYREYKYILLLNNDTVIKDDFLEKMIDLMNEDDSVGFSSCRIDNYFDHSILWNAGGSLRPWGLRHYYTEKELSRKPLIFKAEFITGCALFIRSSVISRYGALTDDFFHGEEDFNFCWRMKKNDIKGVCLNQTLVYHKVGTSSKKIGNNIGRTVSYYVMRFVDMKRFYNKYFWVVWKRAITIMLCLKWRRMGISKSDIKKMKDVLRRGSELDKVTKEDMFAIWDMSF